MYWSAKLEHVIWHPKFNTVANTASPHFWDFVPNSSSTPNQYYPILPICVTSHFSVASQVSPLHTSTIATLSLVFHQALLYTPCPSAPIHMLPWVASCGPHLPCYPTTYAVDPATSLGAQPPQGPLLSDKTT